MLGEGQSNEQITRVHGHALPASSCASKPALTAQTAVPLVLPGFLFLLAADWPGVMLRRRQRACARTKAASECGRAATS